MTTVEILAASYIIAHYTTVNTDQDHVFRLYFDEVPVADTDGAFVFAGYTDVDHVLGWTVRDIIGEVLTRMNSIHGGIQTLTISEVEVWQAESGVNTFLGLDSEDFTGIGGGGTGVAAAYLMLVMKTAARQPSRFTVMDTADPAPQSYRGIIIPATDNDKLEWFFTRSVVGFTAHDGERLAIAGSYNTGYNRKLARSYGRRKSP